MPRTSRACTVSTRGPFPTTNSSRSFGSCLPKIRSRSKRKCRQATQGCPVALQQCVSLRWRDAAMSGKRNTAKRGRSLNRRQKRGRPESSCRTTMRTVSASETSACCTDLTGAARASTTENAREFTRKGHITGIVSTNCTAAGKGTTAGPPPITTARRCGY